MKFSIQSFLTIAVALANISAPAYFGTSGTGGGGLVQAFAIVKSTKPRVGNDAALRHAFATITMNAATQDDVIVANSTMRRHPSDIARGILGCNVRVTLSIPSSSLPKENETGVLCIPVEVIDAVDKLVQAISIGSGTIVVNGVTYTMAGYFEHLKETVLADAVQAMIDKETTEPEAMMMMMIGFRGLVESGISFACIEATKDNPDHAVLSLVLEDIVVILELWKDAFKAYAGCYLSEE
mmetsp:Transcript_1059/g.2497  ORF Transcript_1059/g.2497 Transcript_1059/m.2497 type:complete len:239 (-) Transcript_1059:118-834(-)|eukprot:CAMPEP_0119569874 /NCGR_PEP_ID=MMETSP1352-20130426/42867_1 /TAXON_ID=265584 /ORGANISM="Stauroneis constricta, Strain CCMP1120" /LENGTH=238 /DNA_ID=CAMNT_0007619501 /DNA_START=132 /DNA_END=848 /DNA_ORIENTATION=+